MDFGQYYLGTRPNTGEDQKGDRKARSYTKNVFAFLFIYVFRRAFFGRAYRHFQFPTRACPGNTSLKLLLKQAGLKKLSKNEEK